MDVAQISDEDTLRASQYYFGYAKLPRKSGTRAQRGLPPYVRPPRVPKDTDVKTLAELRERNKMAAELRKDEMKRNISRGRLGKTKPCGLKEARMIFKMNGFRMTKELRPVIDRLMQPVSVHVLKRAMDLAVERGSRTVSLADMNRAVIMMLPSLAT